MSGSFNNVSYSIGPAQPSRLEGQSGSTPFVFNVVRSGEINHTQFMNWRLDGFFGTASASDFTGPTSGSIHFGPGVTNQVITLWILGDTIREPNETFRVLLTFGEGPAIGFGTAGAVGTILADEPTISIAASDARKAEGQWGTRDFIFTLTRTGSTELGDSVDWSVSGIHGLVNAEDFAGGVLPSGRAFFAPGESSTTIAVSVAADVRRELDEEFRVILTNPSAGAAIGTAFATGTILADEPTITGWGSWSVREEGQQGSTPLLFALERSSGLDSWDWVDWSVAGSGANPANAADFAGGALPSGRAFFAPGERWSIITVEAAGDREREADEDFTVTLANPSPGAVLGTTGMTGRILADEPSIRAWGSWNVREEGQFGTTQLFFAAERSGSLDAWDWVDWLVVGSGANPVDHADFAGGLRPWGRAAFAPGERWAVITVDVAGDTLVEPDEEFTLRLMNPSPGVDLRTAELTGRILADEPAIRAWGSWNFRAEGQSGVTPLTFAAERSGDLDGWAWVDWLVVGSGANPVDHADFAGGLRPWGRAAFAPGERWSIITVNVAGDTLVEPDETFSVMLSSPSPGMRLLTTQMEGRILADEPSYAITAANATRAEGNAGTTPFTYTVTRTGPTDAAGWADWSVAGSGASPADAADFGGALPAGRLSFAPGQTTATLTIDVAGDTAVEPDESFRVTLTGAAGGAAITTASADGRILSDDQFFSIGAPASAQGEAPSGPVPFTFTVTRIGATEGAATINWAVVGSRANPANAADFGGTLPSGSLDFAPGQTSRQVTVNVTSDAIAERQEGFAVVLSSPSSGSILTERAEATILADATPIISIADLRQAEGHSGQQAFNFTVSLDVARDVATTVDWAVSALPGGAIFFDFIGAVFPTGRVTIAAGQTSALVPIAVQGDTTIESDDAFTVTLSNPPPGAVLGRAAATGTITNDDSGFAIAANAPSTQGEPTSGVTPFTFTVTRSGALNQAAQVSWAVVGSGAAPANAADFGGALPGGVLGFAPGETRQTITVNVVNDGTTERQEGFAVVLSSPSSGSILTGRAEATILADATPTISIADLRQAEGHSGQQVFNFNVSLDFAWEVATTVDWAVSGLPGGATAADFQGGVFPTGRVTIAAGQTNAVVPIAVQGDTTIESDDAFTVTLSNPPAGAVLGRAAATGTITNDDSGFAIATNAPSTQGEPTSGVTPFTFTVTRSGALNQAAQVSWAVVGSGAAPANAADFGGALPGGVLDFAPGETRQTITVNVARDAVHEGQEAFAVQLFSRSLGTTVLTAEAEATILADLPTVRMVTETLARPEGNTGTTDFVFTLSLSAPMTSTVSVDWAVIVLYANVSNNDFAGNALPSGRATFAPSTTTTTITIPVRGDLEVEHEERFLVSLSNPSGALLGQAGGIGIIKADETRISAVADTAAIREAQSGSTPFTFTLHRVGDRERAEAIDWTVAARGASTVNAADFVGGVFPSGTASFAIGQKEQSITVLVAGDTLVEGDERFWVVLSNPAPGTVLLPNSAAVTILNDDLI